MRWFDDYNEGRSYSEKVKPFGFVLRFSTPALIDLTKYNRKKVILDPDVKPVSPYHKKIALAAKDAFDRKTREQIDTNDLESYEQALAQYHLHPEDKFLNGDYLDRGTTQRRHVFATEIQYIGKESNKWEEQFYFGFDPEEEIRYGARPATRKSIARAVRKIVDTFGLRATAKKIGISRGKLSKLLENGFSGCQQEFLQRILGIVGRINSRLDQEKREISELLRLARREICKIGITEFARRLDMDPANLSKMIEGKRAFSALACGRLQDYFGSKSPARKG